MVPDSAPGGHSGFASVLASPAILSGAASVSAVAWLCVSAGKTNDLVAEDGGVPGGVVRVRGGDGYRESAGETRCSDGPVAGEAERD